MTEARRPTEAERRAVQQAVDAGDMKRAEALLAGVRRRLATSNRNKKKYTPPAATPATEAKPKKGRKSGKPGGDVRHVGTQRFVPCPVMPT